jgi:hypothetical protein
VILCLWAAVLSGLTQFAQLPQENLHIKKQPPPSNNTSTTSTVDESNDGSSNDTATPNTPAEVKKLRSRK